MAKSMLTTREAREFMDYVSEFPIDHQSNHHLPIAILSSLTANANRREEDAPFKPADFMPFGKRTAPTAEGENETDDLKATLELEAQLLGGNW